MLRFLGKCDEVHEKDTGTLIQLAEIGRCHHVLGLEVAAEDVEVGEAAGGGHFADGEVGAFSEQAAGVLQAQAADELWQRLVTAALRKGCAYEVVAQVETV